MSADGEPHAQSVSSRGSRFVQGLLRVLLSAAILASICNFQLYYEQDQLGKAAQILALDKAPSLLHYADVADHYRKDLFSAFYLAGTLLYKVTHAPPVTVLNLLALACGVLTFFAVPRLLRQLFGFNEWLSWVALLFTPMVVVVFSYGNETALAAAGASLAALLLTCRPAAGAVAAGLAFAVAVFARSDYLLLGPALALLAFRQPGYTNGMAGIPWRKGFRRLVLFGGAALIFAILWLVFILRKIPTTGLFEYHGSWALFASFVLCGAGVANLLFALVGVGSCVCQNQWKRWLWLLPILPQSIPYLSRLTSPKYILPVFLISIIFSVLGMRVILRRSRLTFIAILTFFCFFSVTPFGIFGPSKAAIYYLPTDAGPIPTGAYLGFYAKVKAGFFQQRYSGYMEQMHAAMSLTNTAPVDFAGPIYPQIGNLWAEEARCGSQPVPSVPFCDVGLDHDEAHRVKLMLKGFYLYFRKQPDALPKLEAYLNSGRVRARTPEVDPFPNVIEVGLSVPEGTDTALGRRIVFMEHYWHGEEALRRDEFIPEFQAVSCLTRAEYEAKVVKSAPLPQPLYIDEQWVIFDCEIRPAIIYSLRFPAIYSGHRPKPAR